MDAQECGVGLVVAIVSFVFHRNVVATISFPGLAHGIISFDGGPLPLGHYSTIYLLECWLSALCVATSAQFREDVRVDEGRVCVGLTRSEPTCYCRENRAAMSRPTFAGKSEEEA